VGFEATWAKLKIGTSKMAAKIYDITPPISSRLAVFPGDQPFSRCVTLSIAKDQNFELSHVTTTVHLGAHADAPSHYFQNGPSIQQRPLGFYMGRAQVMRVRGLPPGARIEARHLPTAVRASRLLFETGSFPDPEQWTDSFNSLSPELLDDLAGQGVRLVGIDTPSVDPANCKSLDAHKILAQKDIAVLEGLVLKDVPEGLYTLIALPLPIEGGDASPVRAVLLPEIPHFPELV
jgi:arylformamidase